MVLQAGLEPARSFEQKILSLLCLPIPPPELVARAVCARARRISRPERVTSCAKTYL